MVHICLLLDIPSLGGNNVANGVPGVALLEVVHGLPLSECNDLGIL